MLPQQRARFAHATRPASFQKIAAPLRVMRGMFFKTVA